MDEAERDYLRRQIQALENANRRRKTLTIFFLAAFGLLLLLGAGALFTYRVVKIRWQYQQVRREMLLLQQEQARQEMLRAEQGEAEAQRARQAQMQENPNP